MAMIRRWPVSTVVLLVVMGAAACGSGPRPVEPVPGTTTLTLGIDGMT